MSLLALISKISLFMSKYCSLQSLQHGSSDVGDGVGHGFDSVGFGVWRFVGISVGFDVGFAVGDSVGSGVVLAVGSFWYEIL